LAAALTRLRRSFWISSADQLKSSPLIVRTNAAFAGFDFVCSLDVSVKSQLAGLFQGLAALDAGG
jgi:hypothetical protein